MAIPGTPRNLSVQQGNGQVYIQWDLSAGATSYVVSRSVDAITFATVATPTLPNYLDTTVTVGTRYFYQVAAVNTSGTSPATPSQQVIPTLTGQVSLAQVRLMAQQRADMSGSKFISDAEWNSYITQSYFELYDLLTTAYEDYYVAAPQTIVTDGINLQYALPTNFYKLKGVDYKAGGPATNWVTMHKFNFGERNRYVIPGSAANSAGGFDMRYRLTGNTIMFEPLPAASQTVRIWYTPRLAQPLADTDILDGVNGWIEYVVCDAAIKALQKEESDVSILGAEKQALIKRIEESATNRDVGEPDTLTDSRRTNNGGGWSDGSWGMS